MSSESTYMVNLSDNAFICTFKLNPLQLNDV